MDEVQTMITILSDNEVRSLANHIKGRKKTRFSINGGFTAETAPIQILRNTVIKYLQKQYLYFQELLDTRYHEKKEIWSQKELSFVEFVQEVFIAGEKPDVAIALAILLYLDELKKHDWIKDNVDNGYHPFDQALNGNCACTDGMSDWQTMILSVERKEDNEQLLIRKLKQNRNKYEKVFSEIASELNGLSWEECIPFWPRMRYKYGALNAGLFFWDRYKQDKSDSECLPLEGTIRSILVSEIQILEIAKLSARIKRYRKYIKCQLRKTEKLINELEKKDMELDNRLINMKKVVEEKDREVAILNEENEKKILEIEKLNSEQYLPEEVKFSDRPYGYLFITQGANEGFMKCFFADPIIISNKQSISKIREQLGKHIDVEMAVINVTGLNQQELNLLKKELEKKQMNYVMIRANTTIEIVRETISKVALQ